MVVRPPIRAVCRSRHGLQAVRHKLELSLVQATAFRQARPSYAELQSHTSNFEGKLLFSITRQSR